MAAETKWTPGRWDWSPAQGVATGRNSVLTRPARVFVLSGGTSRDLADVGLDRAEEANANARMMSAAPDLYAALDWLAGIIDTSRGVAGYHLNGELAAWEDFDGLIAEVRAALARARGEV